MELKRAHEATKSLIRTAGFDCDYKGTFAAVLRYLINNPGAKVYGEKSMIERMGKLGLVKVDVVDGKVLASLKGEDFEDAKQGFDGNIYGTWSGRNAGIALTSQEQAKVAQAIKAYKDKQEQELFSRLPGLKEIREASDALAASIDEAEAKRERGVYASEDMSLQAKLDELRERYPLAAVYAKAESKHFWAEDVNVRLDAEKIMELALAGDLEGARNYVGAWAKEWR